MIPRATYRLQLNKAFTFDHAREIVPYLDAMGISHIYASPITVARRGSAHGYDVVDPTRINPELGGEDGFRALVDALRARDMGVILDIVPNHMGVGEENGWWMDVLKHGSESSYATTFDIDWSQHGGRMLLPFLGASLRHAIDNGDLALSHDDVSDEIVLRAYDDAIYPLAPGTAPARQALSRFDPATPDGRANLVALLDQQHYRLAWWRSGHDELNWRRFFSVTELAGVRIEDEQVFERTHGLYFRLYGEGLIDGLRVDHIDGLTWPADYIAQVRARLDTLQRERPAPLDQTRAWLVVEKILGPGEHLPDGWDVDGTSGYEFMNLVSALQHDPDGEAALTALWHEVSGRSAVFAPEESLARCQMLDWEFTAQLNACAASFYALAQAHAETAHFTRAMLARAIRALLEVFPVYRTYGTGTSAPSSDAPVRAEARRRAISLAAPGEMPVVDAILAWLAGDGPGEASDAVRQFQQLSSPIAAKSVEDTAFYRYGRLLSRNDVGFDAAQFSLPAAEFHRANRERLERFPHTMLTTATHDHKRGEDVRARLAVLSTIPERWGNSFRRWMEMFGARGAALERSDLYMLCQTLVGTWPPDGRPAPEYAERLWGWQEKALREAKLRSSWAAPDPEYEEKLRTFLQWLMADREAEAARSDIVAFVNDMEPCALRNSLAQTLLRCTLPGVPDLYQGAEGRDFSLVDPDNRRPVDFEPHRASLGNGTNIKQRLIADLLAARKAHPDLFANGGYVPLEVEAPSPSSWFAFARTSGSAAMVCLVPLRNRPRAMPDTDSATLTLPRTLARHIGTPRIDAATLMENDRSLAPYLVSYGMAVGLVPSR